MDAIKVNEQTHEMILQISAARQQLDVQIQTIRAVLGVPKDWSTYNSQLKQFEPPMKE